jgi:hypothetical protein
MLGAKGQELLRKQGYIGIGEVRAAGGNEFLPAAGK